MKILFIHPYASRLDGGPAHSLAGYLAGLEEAGVTADVLTRRRDDDDLTWLGRHAPSSTLVAFPTYGRRNFYASPGALGWMRAKAASYDIVHLHGLFNGFGTPAAHIALSMGKPLVVSPDGMLSRYSFSRRRMLKRAFHVALDARLLRAASAVQFESEREAVEAASLMPDLPQRRWVVGPPVAHPVSTVREARTNTVLFLSRLDPKKNLEAVIDCWPSVLAAIPDATLDIAGDGPASYRDTLIARARSLGAASRSIRFLGFITGAEKARALATAGVFVLPSHHENFGVAVAEAVSVGLPVVISREVQIAHLVEQNAVGIVIGTDPAELPAAIVSALRDGALRSRCESAGPALVAGIHGRTEIGRALAQLYSDMLGGPRTTEPTMRLPEPLRELVVRQ